MEPTRRRGAAKAAAEPQAAEPEQQPAAEQEQPAEPERGRRRAVRPPTAVFQAPVFTAPDFSAPAAARPEHPARHRTQREAAGERRPQQP